MNLTTLIKAKKFDYVDINITEENFPTSVRLPSEKTEYKLFHFDRNISSEKAIKDIEKDGWSPANLYELLSYEWDEKEYVVALGSVAGARGSRRVPCLIRDDSKWNLCLYWFDDLWYPVYHFLAVRNSQTLAPQKSALGNLDALTLRVDKIEKILAHYNLTDI